MNHPFTIRAVSEAIESLPEAQTELEINTRYHWIIRAIEVSYVAECGREELAEQLREFYAGRFDDQIGPQLRELEQARQAEAEALIEEAYRLNETADEIVDHPEIAHLFARDLGRDKRINGSLKATIARTGRTR